jgi:hypothetical protein
MSLTLKQFASQNELNEPGETEHEHTFRIIIAYILQKALPNHTETTITAEERAGFDRLIELQQQQQSNTKLNQTKLACLYIVRDRSMFWKSIFKVMIQFLDLWIRYIFCNGYLGIKINLLLSVILNIPSARI